MSTNEFVGLTMPVFSAFGWAGEEAALSFALSQMELFVKRLYYRLPRETQAVLPVHGLDNSSQSVYLAAEEVPESGLFIAFVARPMSLETSLAVTDKKALSKAYRLIEKQHDTFHELLVNLGSDWNLRIQQMEYDEESEAATHYQDLFKDTLDKLDADTSTNVIARASFLNSESQWVTPIYISRRTDSEKVAAMRESILDTVGAYIADLMPVISLMTGKKGKATAKARPSTPAKAQPKPVVEETTIKRPSDAADLEEFTFVAELKSLHVRRGFINLTANHWPFFAINARTETRSVILTYGDRTDEKCAVWRLVPTDQARLVLSPPVHHWLEDNFMVGDGIQITALKKTDKSIHINLKPLG